MKTSLPNSDLVSRRGLVYSHSQLDDVIDYIMNQKEHHRKKTFKEEYTDFLKKFMVEYDEQYLFNWNE